MRLSAILRVPLSDSMVTLFSSPSKTIDFNGKFESPQLARSGRCNITVSSTDKSKNRKPLQKGRNLSIEAIQTVQALKRANTNKDNHSLDQVFHSKFKRLLKLDMIAVLRELLRQNQCFLALKVFEDVRKEYWYKPQVSLYAEIITVLASNGLFEHVELIHSYLKAESSLEPEIEGFNVLLRTLISYNNTKLAMESYYLMKEVGCEPDKSSFKILINGLESIGETGPSAIIRQDAQEYYGESLEFLEEKEEMTVSNN